MRLNHLRLNLTSRRLSQLLGINVEPRIKSLKQALTTSVYRVLNGLSYRWGVRCLCEARGRTITRVTIPKIKVVNPVGSGDATVAGLAVALNKVRPVEIVLKTAMTTGILNAMEAGTGYINMNKFQTYI